MDRSLELQRFASPLWLVRLWRWVFRTARSKSIFMRVSILVAGGIGFFAVRVARFIPGDWGRTCRGLGQLALATLAWRRHDIERFLTGMERLATMPTIQRGLVATGMQELFDQYWLWDSITARQTPWTAPLQHPQFWIPGLRPRPFLNRDEFPWVRDVEARAPELRAELLKLLTDDGAFSPYMSEFGIDRNPFKAANEQSGAAAYAGGTWKVMFLYHGNKPNEANLARCPVTRDLLNGIPRLDRTFIMYSRLAARTWIPPHFGLSNALIRAHLPLLVPPEGCSIRVGDQRRSWITDELLFFDDSFQHEVWNRSDQDRIVLFFNVFHPDLSDEEVGILGKFLQEELAQFPPMTFWRQVQEQAERLPEP